MAEAGFFLIDEVVWAKESVRIDGTSVGQAMIEPAIRRLNANGHEPFYRFVLNPKQAWSDTCAVRIPRKNVTDIRYLPEGLMKCHTSLQGRKPLPIAYSATDSNPRLLPRQFFQRYWTYNSRPNVLTSLRPAKLISLSCHCKLFRQV